MHSLLFSVPPTTELSKDLSIDGVFVLRESASPVVLLGGLATENGHVVVDRQMQTNIDGCFAAGDCVGKPYQYVKAAGDGNVAAHTITAYLNGQNKA